jgi:hypothetical protein
MMVYICESCFVCNNLRLVEASVCQQAVPPPRVTWPLLQPPAHTHTQQRAYNVVVVDVNVGT